MSDFVQNLLNRHLSPSVSVQPRLRGRFEPSPLTTEMPLHDVGEHGERPANIPPASPSQVTQPLPGILRQAATPPWEQVGRVNPPTSTSPTTVVQPPIPTMPSLKVPDAFSVRPATVEGRSQQYPAFGDERGNPQNQDIKANPEQQLPHPVSSIQPAFSTAEKSMAAPKGLLLPDAGGITGKLPEGLRQNLRTQTMQGQASVPVIKVSIGRIEVRASMQAAPAAPSSMAKTGAQPRLTLEEYLKKQNGTPR